MYVYGMVLAEHTFTFMLRNSGDVIAELEHRDVVLHRRDGEDLFLGLRSREESVREALGALARLLLAVGVDRDMKQRVTASLSTSLPWTTFLPDDERADFFEALTSTAAACVEVDTFEPLARLLSGWRAAAEIHANPELGKVLRAKHVGPPIRIKRPKAS